MELNSKSFGDRGVLYVATGKKYIDEAIFSVTSLKEKMPTIPSVLYTDTPELVKDGFFSHIVTLENPIYTQGDKITPMLMPPFNKTVFLDSDTYVSGNFEDVYEILGKYDIAITHEASRLKNHVPECPECFCEFNSGVIGFLRNKAVVDVMKLWKKTYIRQLEQTGNKSDQGVLRKALYQSDVKLFVLTPEYNYRTKFPGFVGRGVNVKILHGRDIDMSFFAKAMHKRDAKKVVIPSLLMPGHCEVIVPTKSLYWFFYIASGLSCKVHALKKQQSIRWKRRLSKIKKILFKV